MFVIYSILGLYFKGYDEDGIAEFTFSRNEAKTYDECQGQEVIKKLYNSSDLPKFFQVELVIIEDREGA